MAIFFQIFIHFFQVKDKAQIEIDLISDTEDDASLMWVALQSSMDALQGQLSKRMPQCGGATYEYAVAHFLHPFYRGAVLHHLGLLNQTLDQMVIQGPIL